MLVFVLPAVADVPADAVQRLVVAKTWHGEVVGVGAERTAVRAAWERIRDEATEEELRTLLHHESLAVRYGALRALASYVYPLTLPDFLLYDRERLVVCPGGCGCMEDSLADAIATLRFGDRCLEMGKVVSCYVWLDVL